MIIRTVLCSIIMGSTVVHSHKHIHMNSSCRRIMICCFNFKIVLYLSDFLKWGNFVCLSISFELFCWL